MTVDRKLVEKLDEVLCEELDGWSDWSMNGRLREGQTFTREDVYEAVRRVRKKILDVVAAESGEC